MRRECRCQQAKSCLLDKERLKWILADNTSQEDTDHRQMNPKLEQTLSGDTENTLTSLYWG